MQKRKYPAGPKGAMLFKVAVHMEKRQRTARKKDGWKRMYFPS